MPHLVPKWQVSYGVFLLLLAMVAVGCAAPAAGPPAGGPPDVKMAEPPPVTWKAGDDREFPIPPILFSKRRSDRDLLDMGNAESRLISDCMARKGFRYRYLPVHSMPESEITQYPAWSSYGLWRLSDAERFSDGYGYKERGVGAVPPGDENSRYLDTLSPKEQQAYTDALQGTPANSKTIGGRSIKTDSCYHEARTRVYGAEDTFIDDMNVRADIHRVIRHNAIEHSAAVQANERWAACIQKGGFKIEENNVDLTNKTPTERKQIALAAARCDIETGRWSVFSQLQKHYEEQAIKQNEAYFIREAEQRKKSVERAKAILGAPRPIP